MTPLDRLRLWRDLNAERDDLIRAAREGGAPVALIMEASGLKRAMVSRILNREK